MPRRKIDASVISKRRDLELETYTIPLEPPYTMETNSYLLRQLRRNPSNPFSWTSCEATGEEKLERVTCSKEDRNFVFDARTGRFAYSRLGTWHEEASNSDYSGDDAYFSFGTCKPYYD